MGYSYSPASRDEQVREFFGRRGKHLAIAAVIVFFIGVFYFVGNTITGYATYSKSLEQQLNTSAQELSDTKEQHELCQLSLESSNNDRAALNASINKCSSDLFSNKLFLDSCYKEKEKLENTTKRLDSQLSSCNNDKIASGEAYKQLARSSVKAICCSFGDVQSATIRNWNITSNNSIVCSGNYTINCTSGESNY
ncbi:hypothetical protein HY501_00060 [Candidatus Woesearchaeota archaeon]|nr:hypothetical protein [Candidatus Woesearchaeota archaeon]